MEPESEPEHISDQELKSLRRLRDNTRASNPRIIFCNGRRFKALISDGKTFDTNVFFSGGAGMFIQYHDIVKPTYLYAIVKMIITNESFGLPINIIKNMSIFSLIEWYIKRKYRNPFKCLDYNHHLDDDTLDAMLLGYLLHDDSLYRLSPSLNITRMMNVYREQQLTFPIYIYSEMEERHIVSDCKNVFHGIKFVYLHGDLEETIKRCDNNFTYIFSDIELVKKAADVLKGTCSHILLSGDYRYNYKDNCKTFKYNLNDMAKEHPFVRIGMTNAVDMNRLALSFENLI